MYLLFMLWGARRGVGGIGSTSFGVMSRECCWWLWEHVRQSEHSATDLCVSRPSRQFLTGVWSGLCRSGDHHINVDISISFVHLYSQTEAHSSSSRMGVINRNWSATQQHLHLQSVAKISRHSVLSGDRIRQCETSCGSRHKDTVQCL